MRVLKCGSVICGGMQWRFYRSALAALFLAACVPSAVPAPTSAPPTSAIAAEPTRPPSCPLNYPDPKAYNESAYVGTGTVGDRVQLDVWKFLPEDCSYSVVKVEKLAS
jgi:hypothetical protein